MVFFRFRGLYLKNNAFPVCGEWNETNVVAAKSGLTVGTHSVAVFFSYFFKIGGAKWRKIFHQP